MVTRNVVTLPASKPFTFDPPIANPLGRKLMPALAPAVERLFGLSALNELYESCARPGEEDLFLERILAKLGITFVLKAEDLARIPKTGPAMVVANHPFGALDGIIMAAMLKRVRPDVKVMANFLLGRIPDIRDVFILVDPFRTGKSPMENIRPLREAIRWVQNGGMLAVFPAGEVAHADLRTGHVEEPAWSSTIARIARKAAAPVVPAYFHGRNSNTFQLMGLVHAHLRTAMLPRELFKKRGACVDLRVGAQIPHRKLLTAGDDFQLAEFLRQRALMLRHRASAPLTSSTPAPMCKKMVAPVSEAAPAERLAAEIEALPECQMLADGGDMAVYEASAGQIPKILCEIGRLREITYRATGEGTGKPLDIDVFDEWYTHLFIWHKSSQQIVGAYRLGATDEIISHRGTSGLYTSTLFKYRAGLIERLGPSIELGRSFIRAEFQRSYAPLLLLWKGIGRYVLNRPHCKSLFGPVSISNEYRTVSRHVMVRFLEATHGAPHLAELTQPRNPFRPSGLERLDRAHGIDRLLGDGDVIDDVVADLEPDGKGMPVLLRQYLKLGARFFAFNVDPDFSDALDALMLVDLTRTDRKLLQRYMGVEGCASFLAYHGLEQPAPRRGVERMPATV